MEEGRIEGLWDCVYCDQKGIKARYDTCTTCGKARGIETIFYLPQDIHSAMLTEEEKAKTTDAPDWLCDFCGAYNRSDVNVCAKCASLKGESKSNYGMLHKLTGKLFGKNR